jgi:type IV secretion system protein VirB10
MTEHIAPASDDPFNDVRNTIASLPGEAGIPNVMVAQRPSVSKKGLFAVALLVVSLVIVAAFTIQRFSVNARKTDDAQSRLAKDRPSAATAEPRRLEMPIVAAASSAASAPRIPALVPTSEELAEPIGVRRTGATAPTGGNPKPLAPEDAPVLLVTSKPGAVHTPSSVGPATQQPSGSPDTLDTNDGDPIANTTRNLQGYQRQLQQLLDTLSRTTVAATTQGPGSALTGAPAGGLAGGGVSMSSPVGGPSVGGTAVGASAQGVGVAPGGGLFGGQLPGSATPRATARLLGNRSLILPKGTAFTCALKTKVISANSGLVGCQVQRNVFSDDGRVLLIERGSHLDGEYRVASVRPGTVRIPVLWTRIRTPLGVTVDIDSPATGPLGESGVEGYVDNRWPERIGAAMLLSLIDDSVKLVLQQQSGDGNANTVILPSTTSSTSKLAEKVLDSTINIPPLIYQNQGGIVGIYVARDVDFSSVYQLNASGADMPAEGQR